MVEDQSDSQRVEFLLRVQRFADLVLDQYREACKAKDTDEKEARAIRNFVLKLFRIWDKALLSNHDDARLDHELSDARKQFSEVNGGVE